MWQDITHAQRMRLLADIHPKYAFDFYLAEFLTLKELIEIIEPQLHVNAVIKLHCAQGKSIKQAKGSKKSLLDILKGASPQDLLVDLTEICKAVSSSYETTTGYDSYMKVRKRCGYDIKSKNDTCYMPQGNFIYFHPKKFNRAGTFSSLFESIKRCNQEFSASGAQTRFKIKFTSNSICVDGSDIKLPDMMAWTGKEVAMSVFGQWAFVDSYGSATYYGKETESSLRPFMECWNNDALNACEIIGKACSSCILCGRELTDPTSVSSHVGPVCRKRYGTALDFKSSSGPITGTTLAIPPSETKPIVLPSGLIFNIPQRVIDQSPFLQGLFDLDDPSSIDATVFLGVSSEALALLDEILGDAKWVPESIETLEIVLPVSDKLGLDDLTKRLEGMYLEIFHSLEHWTEWEDVQRRVTVKREGMKNNGPVTAFKVPKRKRDIEAHLDFVAALREGDISKMQSLVQEHGNGVCSARFLNLTMAERPNVESKVPHAMEKTSIEAVHEALRLGVKKDDVEGYLSVSWRRPGLFEAYADAGMFDNRTKNALWNSVLRDGGGTDDLARIASTLGPLQRSDYLIVLRSNSTSSVFLWLLEQGIFPKTDDFFRQCLEYINDSNCYNSRGVRQWFIKDCLGAFNLQASKAHLEISCRSPMLVELLGIPAYEALVDSDFVEVFISEIRGYGQDLANAKRVFEIFKGPLEARHCKSHVNVMRIVAAAGHKVTPEMISVTGVVTFCEVADEDTDIQAVVKALACDPDTTLNSILKTYGPCPTLKPLSLKLAEHLIETRQDKDKPLERDTYNIYYYNTIPEYKRLMRKLHDNSLHFLCMYG